MGNAYRWSCREGMAGIAHCTVKAGSHERAGCVRRTVRIECDGHAVALGGEGKEGHKVPMPERPIPQATGNLRIQWSFGKFYLKNSEQSQLGVGCCCNTQCESHSL